MFKNFIYSAVALSLVCAGLCQALPVQAAEDDDPPVVVEEQEEVYEERVEVRYEKDREEQPKEPCEFQIELKNEGDYNIQPDSMAYHNFVTFIYNDFSYFLSRDPRIINACSGNGEEIDVKQKVNEYFTNEEDLSEMSKVIFDRLLGYEREVPYKYLSDNNYYQPTINILGADKNVLHDQVNFWKGKFFENYREEYMKPYSEGEFRFTRKCRAQVRERKGNTIRGWTKKMSLSELSLCAASTPVAIFMDTDEKRIRERNAWMPTPLEDFMYYSSRHQFPYVGFLEYSLKFQDENGETYDLDSTTEIPARGGKIICSWDKLILFELDEIIKAHRN